RCFIWWIGIHEGALATYLSSQRRRAARMSRAHDHRGLCESRTAEYSGRVEHLVCERHPHRPFLHAPSLPETALLGLCRSWFFLARHHARFGAERLSDAWLVVKRS